MAASASGRVTSTPFSLASVRAALERRDRAAVELEVVAVAVVVEDRLAQRRVVRHPLRQRDVQGLVVPTTRWCEPQNGQRAMWTVPAPRRRRRTRCSARRPRSRLPPPAPPMRRRPSRRRRGRAACAGSRSSRSREAAERRGPVAAARASGLSEVCSDAHSPPMGSDRQRNPACAIHRSPSRLAGRKRTPSTTSRVGRWRAAMPAPGATAFQAHRVTAAAGAAGRPNAAAGPPPAAPAAEQEPAGGHSSSSTRTLPRASS